MPPPPRGPGGLDRLSLTGCGSWPATHSLPFSLFSSLVLPPPSPEHLLSLSFFSSFSSRRLRLSNLHLSSPFASLSGRNCDDSDQIHFLTLHVIRFFNLFFSKISFRTFCRSVTSHRPDAATPLQLRVIHFFQKNDLLFCAFAATGGLILSGEMFVSVWKGVE